MPTVDKNLNKLIINPPVANPAALTAISSGLASDGILCEVVNQKRLYYLDKLSTENPDDSAVIAASGGGNWVQAKGRFFESVANESALIALPATSGDMAYRTDNKSYYLRNSANTASISDWNILIEATIPLYPIANKSTDFTVSPDLQGSLVECSASLTATFDLMGISAGYSVTLKNVNTTSLIKCVAGLGTNLDGQQELYIMPFQAKTFILGGVNWRIQSENTAHGSLKSVNINSPAVDYQITLDDWGKCLVLDAFSGMNNVIIPQNSTLPLPVGYFVDIINVGAIAFGFTFTNPDQLANASKLPPFSSARLTKMFTGTTLDENNIAIEYTAWVLSSISERWRNVVVKDASYTPALEDTTQLNILTNPAIPTVSPPTVTLTSPPVSPPGIVIGVWIEFKNISNQVWDLTGAGALIDGVSTISLLPQMGVTLSWTGTQFSIVNENSRPGHLINCFDLRSQDPIAASLSHHNGLILAGFISDVNYNLPAESTLFLPQGWSTRIYNAFGAGSGNILLNAAPGDSIINNIPIPPEGSVTITKFFSSAGVSQYVLTDWSNIPLLPSPLNIDPQSSTTLTLSRSPIGRVVKLTGTNAVVTLPDTGFALQGDYWYLKNFTPGNQTINPGVGTTLDNGGSFTLNAYDGVLIVHESPNNYISFPMKKAGGGGSAGGLSGTTGTNGNYDVTNVDENTLIYQSDSTQLNIRLPARNTLPANFTFYAKSYQNGLTNVIPEVPDTVDTQVYKQLYGNASCGFVNGPTEWETFTLNNVNTLTNKFSINKTLAFTDQNTVIEFTMPGRILTLIPLTSVAVWPGFEFWVKNRTSGNIFVDAPALPSPVLIDGVKRLVIPPFGCYRIIASLDPTGLNTEYYTAAKSTPVKTIRQQFEALSQYQAATVPATFAYGRKVTGLETIFTNFNFQIPPDFNTLVSFKLYVYVPNNIAVSPTNVITLASWGNAPLLPINTNNISATNVSVGWSIGWKSLDLTNFFLSPPIGVSQLRANDAGMIGVKHAFIADVYYTFYELSYISNS